MEDINYYTKVCSRLTLQNKSLGFFKYLLNKIVPFVNIHEFLKCETDLERVTYCAEHFWDVIGAELIFRGKNNEEAIAKRLEGNSAFANANFEKALILFSQSIVKAIPSKDLALAYANRSAALQKLKEWRLAIADIELAIRYDYPDESRHKLYERMASCHIKLKNFPQAKISAGLCQHFMTKHNISDEEYLKKIAKHLQTVAANLQEAAKKTKTNEEEFHGRTLKRSDKFPSGSTKMQVNYTPDSGRFVYAENEIESGEIILEEEPFAKALLINRLESYCLHCFAKLRVAVACETCSNVAFCSKSCRQKADKYHRFECRVFSLLIGSGMSVLPHLALRMVTQSTPDELLSKVDLLHSKPDEIVLNADGTYDSLDYVAVYNLSALELQRTPEDFLERTIMTIFLMKCLRLVGYFELNLFKNPYPTQVELQVGALLLRNLQILQFNAYEISEFVQGSNKNLSNSTGINLGLGIYPTAAFFNHSCAPNVTRYFNGTKIVVMATERIPSGQAILDNYGPLFTKMSKKERQYQLEGRYWFKCCCEACVGNWPTFENMAMEISSKNDKDAILLKQLQKLDSTLFEEGMKAMERGDTMEAAKHFITYLNASHSILNEIPSTKPYKTSFLAKEALKLCLPAMNM